MAFPNPRRITGVISGMVVWAVWFVLVYGLTGVGCDAGWHARQLPAGNLLSLTMLIATILALALIAWCAWLGYAAWQAYPRTELDKGKEAAQRQRFLGLIMCILALLAGIGTVLSAIPILMLNPCAR